MKDLCPCGGSLANLIEVLDSRAALCLGLFVTLVASFELPVVPADAQEEVRTEEYAVYNALLSNIAEPKENARMLIVDQTLDLKCGASADAPILMNGCGGMLMPPDSPDGLHRLLQDRLPHLQEGTWADLRQMNSHSYKLQDRFHTSWAHHFVDSEKSDHDAGAWKWADVAFYLSRVGLNTQKTEAVVFVFLASYTQGVPSSGDYFLFRINKDHQWQPEGRVQYYATDQGHAN
jgi:hypothetical protein